MIRHAFRAVTAVAVLTTAVLPPSFADEPVGLDRMAQWFQEHPEQRSRPSSGWKPFQRAVWFAETHGAVNGADAARLRRDAFAAARARIDAAPRGAGWFAAGPAEFSGRALAIDFHPLDPSTVFVGTASGGLWKTTDGGATWIPTTDDLPTLAVGGVCVLASDPDVVLIGTGEGTGVGFVTAGLGIFGIGLLKSTDGGLTWGPTSLTYPRSGPHGFNIIVDNPTTGTVLAAANDGLWRSSDEGDTWTRVLDDGNFFDVKWKPGDPSTVYVSKGRDPFLHSQNDNGVFVSTDDGLTFTLAGFGQPDGSLIGNTRIAVTVADPEVIYAHYVSRTSQRTLGIYRSTDGGASWLLRHDATNMTGGQGWYNCVIAADPNDADRVITGGVALYVSDDGGRSYTDLNGDVPFGDDTAPHWDNHAIAYEPGSTSTLWIATDGGTWRSTDDGATWSEARDGIMSYQFYDICVAQSDPFFAMGGTQDNGIPGRTGLDTWFHSTLVADGMVCNVHPTIGTTVYAEWQNGNHVVSHDGGQTWAPNRNGITGAGSWITPVDIDLSDGSRLFTSTSDGIFRTTNGGGVWSRVASHLAKWISISAADGDVVWTVHPESGLYVTTDGGTTWTPRGSVPEPLGLVTKVAGHPTEPGTAFVTYSGYGTGGPHVVTTSNFGVTWTDVTGDLPDQPANTFIVDPARPGDWYVGTDTGVWTSSDAGSSWIPYGVGLTMAVVTDLEVRRPDRKLVAGTYGRAMWETTLPEVVGVADAPTLAERVLLLDRPHPLPAREGVTLRFAARADGAATLAIYDVQGRVVDRVVVNARADGVIRMTRWDASAVAPGVYFAVLEAGGHRITRRVVIDR